MCLPGDYLWGKDPEGVIVVINPSNLTFPDLIASSFSKLLSFPFAIDIGIVPPMIRIYNLQN